MNKLSSLLAILMLAIPAMALAPSEQIVSIPFVDDFATDTNTWWPTTANAPVLTFGVADSLARDNKTLKFINPTGQYQSILSVDAHTPGDFTAKVAEVILPNSFGGWFFSKVHIGVLTFVMGDHYDPTQRQIEIYNYMNQPATDILNGAYVGTGFNWNYSTKYEYRVSANASGVTVDIVNLATGTSLIAGPRTVAGLTLANMKDGSGNVRIALNTINGDSTCIRNIDYVEVSPAIAPFTAWNPNPADGSTDVVPTTKLSWSAGYHANRHNVYFGKNLSDVSDSATPVSLEQSDCIYDPCGLEFGRTYYWRVDEVNTTEPNIWKGNTWSFTVGDKPFCGPKTFADLNGNSSVDFNDFSLLAKEWGRSALVCGALKGDLNGDLTVDEKDIAVFAASWLKKASCKYVDTASTVGLDNGKVRIEFDRTTGKMVVLKNLVTSDNYLKGTEVGGNPFRAYVDTTQMPTAATQANPFPVQPVEGDMGGMIVDPKNCQLANSSFVYDGSKGVLSLQLYHAGTHLTFDLDIVLADGDVMADFNLTVRNSGTGSHNVMTAIPYLTGLSLGPNPATNLAMRLHGGACSSRAPAWINGGGVYGQMWCTQWDAVYDVAANEALGLIHKDASISNKVFHRFPAAGMSTLYFDKHTLNNGSSFTYPTVGFVVNEGSWKTAARRYGDWMKTAFVLRQRPEWFDKVTQYVGLSWMDTPYNQMPQKMMLFPFYDIVEYAHYWVDSEGSIGSYVLRDDLGGVTDFAQGAATANALEHYPGLYVAAYSLSLNDPLLAGKNPNDFLLMDYPGKTVSGDRFFACVGYAPWRDNIAQNVKRLVQTIGVKSVRIDEFGGFYWPCYNPVHGHSSPYNSNQWTLDFARRIREAVDEVDPNVILLAEGVSDVMHQYLDGGLQMWSSGKDISPMSLAVPGYQLISYHNGAADCALNGWMTARRTGANEEAAWVADYFNNLWGPGGEKKPANYIYPGPNLKWGDLVFSFTDAVTYETTIDINPVVVNPVQTPAQQENWDGRIWKADKYYMMVCGNRDASDLTVPTKVKLPALPDPINFAYEFDIETLQLSTDVVLHDETGTYVTTTSGLGAILMPLADCPPIIVLGSEPAPNLTRGSAAKQINLIAFSPWRSAVNPTVTVRAPGLKINNIPESIEVTLPATISLSAASSAISGDYMIYVTGENVLPAKRWFHVY